MRVPLLDLCAQYQSLKAPIDAAVLRVLASGRYVMGPELTAFEEELARYLGTKHAVAVSSGTDALLAAAMALDLGIGCGLGGESLERRTGGEVVTTAYSFFATPETAVRLGLRPVFVDVGEDGFNPDIDQMLARITPQTRAILPVHLFGRRIPDADLKRLSDTGLPVIEDAAQTLVPGIGRQTACATLSFFPSKNLGAAGDAGAVVTDNTELYDRLTIMRQHGSRPKYVHHVWGGNFRMDPIQAAILRIKLQHLDGWHRQRRQNAAHYRAQLSALSARGLVLPEDHPEHVYHHFVIRTPQRDELRKYLAEREIETEVYYPMALHLQPCFSHLGYKPGDLPRAEAAVRESLALPVHADLSSDQLDFVAESVRAFFQR